MLPLVLITQQSGGTEVKPKAMVFRPQGGGGGFNGSNDTDSFNTFLLLGILEI